MTKLEEKLIELGYEKWQFSLEYLTYIKPYNDNIDLNVNITNKIVDYFVYVGEFTYKTQQDIDNIQQAFNQLTKDLEVLRE